MKPMVYEELFGSKTLEVLYGGNVDGYNCYIISYGTHPCAYVEIPKIHPLYKKEYNSKKFLNIDCHWGITYSQDFLRPIGAEKSWFIGWDYAHSGDRYGQLIYGKEWTTEEIFEEVKHVVKQLKDMED